jgi:hypothetical protein
VNVTGNRDVFHILNPKDAFDDANKDEGGIKYQLKVKSYKDLKKAGRPCKRNWLTKLDIKKQKAKKAAE